MLEAFGQTHVTATEQPHVQTVRQSMHVKEREHGEVAIVAGKFPAGRQRQCIRRKVAVREHGTF